MASQPGLGFGQADKVGTSEEAIQMKAAWPGLAMQDLE